MKFPTYPESAERHSRRTMPRLTMDEYIVFVDQLIAHADPAKLAHLRALKKDRIRPFRLNPADRPGVRSNM